MNEIAPLVTFACANLKYYIHTTTTHANRLNGDIVYTKRPLTTEGCPANLNVTTEALESGSTMEEALEWRVSVSSTPI